MSEGEKSLEEEVKELKKAVSALIELEKARLQLEIQKAQQQQTQPQEPQIDKEALYQDLRQVHLGELVIFAIKKDLIPRGRPEE